MPERALCTSTLTEPTEIDFVDGEVPEESGIVPSPTTPGLLWMHNDSGDSAQLYAVTTAGRVLGALVLPDVVAVDFEDLAAAPCPDALSACLWVADVGDNGASREAVAVYAVQEPAIATALSFGTIDAQRVWHFPFALEGGPGDVEGVVVLPDASAVILYEKINDGARILRLDAPFLEDTLGLAEQRGTFDTPGSGQALRLVTAADLHPTGARLLVRTYAALWEVDLSDGLALHAITQSDFVQIATPTEAQGEAACYDEDGTGVWTVSEQVSVGGFTLPNALHHMGCAP
jgi:hypothetical protein